MQKQMYRIMACIILATFTSIIAFSQPKIGEQIPEINLKNSSGKLVSTDALKGKIFLIDFWASWCMPCRAANTWLKPLYKNYNKKGFQVYAISIDEDKADWQTAIKQDATTWLHVLDAGGFNSSIASKWNIEVIPTSFLVDANGKILAISPTEQQLKKLLAKLFL